MRIVSKKKLVDCYTKHATSKTALEEWYEIVSKAGWQNLYELKNSFASADYVGKSRVIFISHSVSI